MLRANHYDDQVEFCQAWEELKDKSIGFREFENQWMLQRVKSFLSTKGFTDLDLKDEEELYKMYRREKYQDFTFG